jgi:hypothetical protein
VQYFMIVMQQLHEHLAKSAAHEDARELCGMKAFVIFAGVNVMPALLFPNRARPDDSSGRLRTE